MTNLGSEENPTTNEHPRYNSTMLAREALAKKLDDYRRRPFCEIWTLIEGPDYHVFDADLTEGCARKGSILSDYLRVVLLSLELGNAELAYNLESGMFRLNCAAGKLTAEQVLRGEAGDAVRVVEGSLQDDA